jgi:hypothetical protein
MVASVRGCFEAGYVGDGREVFEGVWLLRASVCGGALSAVEVWRWDAQPAATRTSAALAASWFTIRRTAICSD